MTDIYIYEPSGSGASSIPFMPWRSLLTSFIAIVPLFPAVVSGTLKALSMSANNDSLVRSPQGSVMPRRWHKYTLLAGNSNFTPCFLQIVYS